MLKKGDIVLLVVVFLVIAAGLVGGRLWRGSQTGSRRIAVIQQENRVIRKIDIDKIEKPERIAVGGKYSDTVLVEKGRIRFEEANCPDKICVKAGWLSNKGDMVFCLPNRTMIKIEGEDSKVDGVTF